jgi:hypothetical protein
MMTINDVLRAWPCCAPPYRWPGDWRISSSWRTGSPSEMAAPIPSQLRWAQLLLVALALLQLVVILLFLNHRPRSRLRGPAVNPTCRRTSWNTRPIKRSSAASSFTQWSRRCSPGSR